MNRINQSQLRILEVVPHQFWLYEKLTNPCSRPAECRDGRKRKELSEVSFREYEKTPLINKVNRWEKSVQFDLQQIEELIDEAEKKMDIISTNEELENFTKENVKYTVLKLTIPDEDSNGCF